MNSFAKYLCLIWALVFVASCVDTPAPDEYVPGSEAHYLEVSQTELSFGAEGDTKNVNVASSQNWLFTDYAPWISFSRDNGEGDSEVSIVAEENLSADIVRTSIFYLRTTDVEFAKAMSADQKAASPYILFTPEAINASGNSGQYRINIKSNTNWNVKCDVDWLTLTPADDRSYIDVSLSENLTNDVRTANIIVAGVKTETFVVTQKAANLIAETNTLEYPQSGGTYLLRINSEVAWSAITSCDWIDVTPISGNAGETEITISTSSNWDSNSRTGSVGLYIGDQKHITVLINQQGVSLSVNDELTFRALGGSKEVEVNTNISWEVLAKPDWISVTPENADGSSMISIAADNNSGETNRTGVIKIGKEGLTQTAEISVEQDGKYFSVDNENLSIGSEGGKMQVSISTNDSWTVSLLNKSQWISVSEEGGEENRLLEFVVDDNPSIKSRCDTAIINSQDFLPVNVVIRQSARFLTIDAKNVQFFSKGGTSAPIVISTDGQYTISEHTDWFSVSHEGDVITVNAEVNETGHVRTGDITISLTELIEGSLSLTLTVTQVAPGGNFSREDYTEDNIWDAKYGNVFTLSVVGYCGDEIWDGFYGSGNIGKDDYNGDESYNSDNGSGNIGKDNHNGDDSYNGDNGTGTLGKDDYLDDDNYDNDNVE